MIRAYHSLTKPCDNLEECKKVMKGKYLLERVLKVPNVSDQMAVFTFNELMKVAQNTKEINSIKGDLGQPKRDSQYVIALNGKILFVDASLKWFKNQQKAAAKSGQSYDKNIYVSYAQYHMTKL